MLGARVVRVDAERVDLRNPIAPLDLHVVLGFGLVPRGRNIEIKRFLGTIVGANTLVTVGCDREGLIASVAACAVSENHTQSILLDPKSAV